MRLVKIKGHDEMKILYKMLVVLLCIVRNQRVQDSIEINRVILSDNCHLNVVSCDCFGCTVKGWQYIESQNSRNTAITPTPSRAS